MMEGEKGSAMKTIRIDNVPADLYAVLESMARASRRSLEDQVLLLLEREARRCLGDSPAAARQWRRRLAGRALSDTVAQVREDRPR